MLKRVMFDKHPRPTKASRHYESGNKHTPQFDGICMDVPLLSNAVA